MDEGQNSGSWLTWILVIGLVWAIFFRNPTYEDQTAEEWFNEYDQCTISLEKANSNIEDVNSKIEEAKYCDYGCSYEDMQDAINNLETADTVDY